MQNHSLCGQDINTDPPSPGKSKLRRLFGTLLCIAYILFLICLVLYPLLIAGRELLYKHTCMINLWQISKGCVVYTNCGDEVYPSGLDAMVTTGTRSDKGVICFAAQKKYGDFQPAEYDPKTETYHLKQCDYVMTMQNFRADSYSPESIPKDAILIFEIPINHLQYEAHMSIRGWTTKYLKMSPYDPYKTTEFLSEVQLINDKLSEIRGTSPWQPKSHQ